MINAVLKDEFSLLLANSKKIFSRREKKIFFQEIR